MKLGISASFPHSSPEEWANLHRQAGLTAVVFPCSGTDPTSKIDAYRDAAKETGLLIAEVGAWSNPMNPNPADREKNIAYCIRQLELAEYVGARCCVNISGAVGEVWDGSYPENYTAETYEQIVETTRRIIDAVNPKTSAYALEPMPHMLPDSPESNLQLYRDVDRAGFGVHLDLVNIVASPRIFYENRSLTDRCFSLLGPYIRSCHLKDAALDHSLTVSIREVPVGEGGIDLPYYLSQTDATNPELPMILEHLPNIEAYRRAIAYVKSVYPDGGNA